MSESTVTLPSSAKKVESGGVQKERKCYIFWAFFNALCALALIITVVIIPQIQHEDFNRGERVILKVCLVINILMALKFFNIVKRRIIHEIAIDERDVTLYVMYNNKKWRRYGPVRSACVGLSGRTLNIRYERSSCLDIFPWICFRPMGMDAQQCKTYLGIDEQKVGAVTTPMAKVDV